MSEWISVEDRFPSNCELVLCRLDFGVTACAMYSGLFFLFEFMEVAASESWLPRVTHWMPLPEPPKD